MSLSSPTRVSHQTPLACEPSSDSTSSNPPSRSLPDCCQVPCHFCPAITAVTIRPPCQDYHPLPLRARTALSALSSSATSPPPPRVAVRTTEPAVNVSCPLATRTRSGT